MINVVIVDDHPIFRNGMKLLLQRMKDVKVIGEASGGKSFLELLEKCTPDLVFMDINMPGIDGITATSEALRKMPGLKIIGLSSFGDSDTFNRMIYAGVEGFMLKNSEIEDFRKAITRVMEGGNYFSEELLFNLTKSVVSGSPHQKLIADTERISEREKEVLALICKGYSNEKIGNELHISGRSVERYKTNLLGKTGAANTVNLVIYAFRNKLVDL